MTNAELSRFYARSAGARDAHFSPTLPAVDGLCVDAVVARANRRSADAAWYDAFALPDGRIVVSVGDVAGGGSTVSALILAVREAAAVAADSAAFLDAVDALFRGQTATALTTATVGIVDLAERTFCYVTAGHPPPFVRYRDGIVAALPADGLPVGFAEVDHPAAHVVVDLRDVAFLALYSSGLIHTTRDIADGMERLQRILSDERMTHCGSPAAWLERRMLRDRSHGEVALLALSFAAQRSSFEPAAQPVGERPHWSVSWSFEATGPSSNGARRAFLAVLRSKETSGRPLDYGAAELIFGELLGNVVRHAPGLVEITLDWSAELPVLHVLDNGPGFRSRRSRERLPADDWSESGRGLFIINACATDFRVRNREGRGTHASATLPLS